MTAAIQFRVSGRVQGVGFRYATQQAARDIGVNGWVRNRRDGDVEGVAEGETTSLDAFVDWLRQGPRHAVVGDVSTSDQPLSGFRRFDIVR